MTNADRRQLLDRFRASGMEGSILDVFKAYGEGRDLISEHYAQQQAEEPAVLTTPEEQQQGLRPYHQAGDVKRSAVFKDVPPNTPFNTHGMKVPINIEKYNEQGHLVESHKSVPPGVNNIPTGPYRGDVIETPAEGYRDGGFLQKGGARKDEDYNMKRALELGYEADEDGHYPSVDHETGMLLKSKQHPTVKLEFMSQMLSPERKLVANPTGYFGDYQLQYVDRKQKGGKLEEKSGMSPEEYSKAYNEAVEKYGEDVALAFDPETRAFGVGNQMLPTAEVSAKFEPKTKEERDAYNNLGVAGALQMRDMHKAVNEGRRKFAEDYMMPAVDAVMLATGVGDAVALGRGAVMLGRAGLKGLGKFAAKQTAKRKRPVPSQKDLDKYVDSGKYMLDQLKGTKAGAKIKTGVADEVVPVKHGTASGDLTADKIKLFGDVPTLGARPGKAKIRGTELEKPGGFYTARGDQGKFFGTDSKAHQVELKIPKGSRYIDLKNTGMSTDVMSKGDLQKLYQDGYDYIIGKNVTGFEEIIPLNPEILQSFKYNYLKGGVRRKIGGEVKPTDEDKPALTNTWDARGVGKSNLFSGRSDRKQAKADMMSYKVANYMTEMYDDKNGKFRTESDPRAAKYIQGMFAEVGAPKNNSVDNPWSAATVSHFAKTFDPEFEGSPLHADYVNRAFQKDGNYRANRVSRNKNYDVGDILFRGRPNSSNPEWDSSDWKFSDFKKAGREGRRYSSHTDIIVGTGSDKKGTYYEVLGGNRGTGPDGTQTTKIERLYAKDINRRYQGAMQTGRRVNPSKPSNTTFKGRTTKRLRRK